MITTNDCKVRYWVGTPAVMRGEYGYYGDSIRKALKDLSDLLPPYLISDEDEYSYVYFLWEPNSRVLELLRGIVIYHDCFWDYQKEDPG